MAENKMSEVAKLLNLELREEFKIKGLSSRYRFTDIGLQYYSETGGYWLTSNKLLPMLLQGEISIIKVKLPILDDIEKKYLSNVIKPFRNRVFYIRKYYFSSDEFIEICVNHYKVTDDYLSFALPLFKKETMYKGMQIGKRYTVEELDL